MRTVVLGLSGIVVAAALSGVAAASLPDTIDLESLDDVAAVPVPHPSVWDDVPIRTVGRVQPGESRFYVTGILGESFATLADPVYAEVPGRGSINRSVLTAGGAAGMAFERENGRLRIEAEGRGRDDVTAAIHQPIGPALRLDMNWAAADGWSALVNVWRDYTVSEQVDVYMGGGVGGGGYRYSLAGAVTGPGPGDISYGSNAQVASFAWQAGGGVVWNFSDRVAFDVGYRFFSIDQSDATLYGYLNGIPIGSLPLLQQFTASELLFGLRIYEPFRRWR
jgi:opacity protein-like surface antigen